MALVKRGEKLQPISAAEYDAVVDQVQVIADQFADKTKVMLNAQFNTYSSMLISGTPLNTTYIRVLNDEDKGIENSTYIWYPDGERLWVASTSDN